MGNELQVARAKVEAALKLLDSETADGIIGTSTEELQVLEQGAQAALTMVWGMVQACGVRKKKPALKAIAQATLMVAMMVHTAYALGIRRGQPSPPAPLPPAGKGSLQPEVGNG